VDIEYNGVRELFEVSPDTSLGELLHELRRKLAEHGQVIAELTLDGDVLTESREAELGGEPVASFTLLAVTGMSAAALVRHILFGLGEAIGGLQDKSAAIGRLLQAGKRTEALESLDLFVSDLAAFSDGIGHSFAFLAVQKVQAFPSVDTELAALRALLERMQELLAAEDEVEFADLFRYEVPEHLASWRSFLDLTNKTLAQAAHEEERFPRCN
jgi:hypothetical protein